MAPRKPVSLWITSETARFVTRDLNISLAVVHAWVWEESVEYARTLGGHLSKARDQLSIDRGAAYDAHKSTYSEGINNLRGNFHRDALRKAGGLVTGPALWRPTTQAHVVTLTRANAVRGLRKVGEASGAWPIALGNMDEVRYVTSDPDPEHFAATVGLPLGRALGEWKLARSVPLDDHLGELDYAPGRVRALLKKLDPDA